MKQLLALFMVLLGVPLLFSLSFAQQGSSSNTWTAERYTPKLNASPKYTVSVVTLSGPVNSEATRQQILKEVRKLFPFDSLKDEMRIVVTGIGADDAVFALATLTKIINGTVTIKSGKLSLRGQINSNEDTEAFKAELSKSLPSGLALGNIDINSPHIDNYTWSAMRSPTSIFINGFVPSITAKEEIFTEAKTRFPDYEISDNTIVATGAPDDFLSAAKTGLKQLDYASAYANAGSVRIANSGYSLALATENPHGVPNDTLKDAVKTTAEIELPSSIRTQAIEIVAPTQAKDERSVDLLFATDRVRQDSPYTVGFGSERSDLLAFGAVRVHVPEDHRIGNIELPSQGYKLFGFTLGRDGLDPKKHFSITGTEMLDIDAWKSQISGRGDEALVFVHGYNTSFQDSVFRLAQVVWDLQYKGPAVLFSWPSKGEVLSYEWDRNSALIARAHFIELIKILERQAGIKKVHVLAHSMGNFLVLDALSNYAQTADPLSIGQIIMAAPDIDADQYKQDVSNLTKIVSGMTLYASSKDAAILLSRTLAQGRRAGDVVNGIPIIVPGVDAIDVSAIGSEELGLENHNTFATKRSLIDDINLVLEGVRPPSRRLPEIRGVPDGAQAPTFWRYAP